MRFRGRSQSSRNTTVDVLALICLSIGVFVAFPAQIQAQDRNWTNDYDVENQEWNGLSELHRILTQNGREVTVDETLDLSTLTRRTPVVLIYPLQQLPSDDLVNFVRDGGRLLLADDFGTGAPLASALNVTTHYIRPPHWDFFRGNERLPVFQVTASHPLIEGVNRVMANHPVVLEADGVAMVSFADDRFGLLYELTFVPRAPAEPESREQQGVALVLGDPSMFINFMLGVMDNRTLVLNLFDYLCEDLEPCQIHLLTRDTAIIGEYDGRVEEVPPERWLDRLRSAVTSMNERLAAIPNFRPNLRGLLVASVLLSLAISVFLFTAIPPLRPRWLNFSFRSRPWQRSRSEFEWNLERLLREGKEGDYGLAIAILKDEFEDLFFPALAVDPSELRVETKYAPDRLQRFSQRYARRVASDKSASIRRSTAAKALSTLGMLARIPARNNLVPEVDGRYSERLLRRIHSEIRDLLVDLELWEDYERRTGRPTAR